jgi:iron complex outermembrane receptor protein
MQRRPRRSAPLATRATCAWVRSPLVPCLGLCALLWSAFAWRALAHDEPTPPRVLQEVDGTWPTGVRPGSDVVVPMLLTVSAEGAVRDCSIDVSLGPALDAAALEAARQWRFEPAVVEGNAVAARARIAVRFRGPTALEPAAEPAVTAAAALDAGAPAPVAAPLSAEAGAPEPEATEPTQPAPSAAAPDAGPASAPIHASHQSDAHAHTEVTAVAHGEGARRSASELVRDRSVLSAAPHRTASDLLLTVPGVFVTQHSGEGKAHQIFYRGFDADHGQDVEIWVGGAPINEVSNLHGQGYADLHFVMPEVVRALRVSPGAYDPRQGDFAIAGSMRFDLGYDHEGISAKAGYGSFGTQRYFLAYRPKGKPEATFGAAEFYTTDGFGPSRAALRASGIAQGHWHFGNTSARLLLTGYTGQFDSAGVLRLSDIESGAKSRFDTYDPRQGGNSMRSQLVGEIQHRWSNASFGITPYLVLRSLRLRQNFTGYLLDPDGDSTQQLNDALTLGGTAFYRMRLKLFSAADSVEVGVSARNDWIYQSQKRISDSGGVTANEVDAKIRALNVAGYLDVALHPLPMLTVRGGVRIDGLGYQVEDRAPGADGLARSAQGMHVGPKATVEARILPGLSALVSYGEGFRSPQARSLAQSERTPFTRAYSFEGGLRYVREQLQLSGAGFGTWLSEDLVFDPVTTRNEPVPATRRAGVSVDASYRPLPWLFGNAHLTYTRSQFRESDANYDAGDLVPYAPQLVARADVAATPVLGEWLGRKLTLLVGTGFSAMARRPLPNSLWGHDIFLLDAQAGLRWGEVALTLKAYNLLGANWYDGEFYYASNWDRDQAPSLVPTRHVTTGAPRTLFATLEIYL